jgi:photosystem II stability/assembly factor-like uncharacterized protein
MTDHSNPDLSAQIRTLFPGDAAAVSADEAIGVATTQTGSSIGRRHIRDGRRAPRTIGLRPAIVWGLALIAASIALGVGIGAHRSSSHSINPSTHQTTQTSTTNATKTALRIGDSVGYRDLDAISFASDDLGFGVATPQSSNAGAPIQQMLVTTDDGGERWIVKRSIPDRPNGPLRPVFASNSNGFLWALSERTITRTDDGGKSWASMTLEAPALDTAQFGQSMMIVEGTCSASTGLDNIGCNDVWVAWSSDGGWTWRQTQISTPRDDAFTYTTTSASVASSTEAYLVADGGVYVTEDSGSNWQVTGADPCLSGGSNVNTIEISATQSPVPTEFVSCGGQGSAGNQSKAVYRSNGGGSWILEGAVAWFLDSNTGSFGRAGDTFGYVGPLQAVSSTTAYMVLEDRGVFFTTDGGKDWKVTKIGAAGRGGGTGSVQFVDPNHGWALFTGAEGLFRTTNGSNWAPLDGTPGTS